MTLADDRYAIPLAVMVRSLLEHWHPIAPLDLIIIDGGIQPENRKRLEHSWRDTLSWPRTTLRFVPPQYGTSHLPVWGRMSKLTYSRISLSQYADPHHQRVLYLDSDMLLLTNPAELASTDLSQTTIAAAQDPFIPMVSSVAALANFRDYGLDAQAPYFNAGLLLVNLHRWRDQHVAERAFTHIQNFGHLLHHFDQDALNAVLALDWLMLDPGWQANPRAANALGLPQASPKLYHFSGRFKPWEFLLHSPADRLFYETLDRTAWKGWRPKDSWQSRFLRLYDSPLRRPFYPIETRLLHRRRTQLRQNT